MGLIENLTTAFSINFHGFWSVIGYAALLIGVLSLGIPFVRWFGKVMPPHTWKA